MSTPESADAKARLLAQMRGTKAPTRRAARAQTWLVFPAGVIVAAALYFALDGPEHGRGRPVWFYVAAVLSWIAVAALSVAGALGHGRASSWRSRPVLLAIVVGTPALLFAAMLAMAIGSPDVTALHAERIGFKCFGLTLAAAAFPFLALLRIRRESDPVHPGINGAALGAACGASSGVMVELWCPVGSASHIALGHVLPIVVLSALGAVLGARVLAIRGRRR